MTITKNKRSDAFVRELKQKAKVLKIEAKAYESRIRNAKALQMSYGIYEERKNEIAAEYNAIINHIDYHENLIKELFNS